MKEEYLSLQLPPIAPPGWIFGPVWTILYIMMAAAAYRIFKLGWNKPAVKVALILFSSQLFFNLIWTPLFFNWQMRGVAFLDIFLLLIALITTTLKFFELDKTAGYLLIPYLVWVSFASVLNMWVWLLNR